MRVFQEPDSDNGRNALTFALGALGGLAIGLLLYRRAVPGGRERMDRFGSDLRDRARTVGTGLGERARTMGSGLRDRAGRVARRVRPARLRRMAVEQEELVQLEDLVLDAFLGDPILGERGIDIGAISPGIIELSGSVRTEEEADRAVHAANAVEGVRTVVNRLDIESEMRNNHATEGEGSEWTGRMVGMNRRRQGRQTDPETNDDSQPQTIKALRNADLSQLEDEDISHEQPRVQRRPDAGDPWQVNFDEDELDNQDPHGKHAAYTLDEPPQDLNSAARVGEGMKKAERLTLEKSDVPLKPKSGGGADNSK